MPERTPHPNQPFWAALRQHGERTALVHPDGRTLSYQALADLVAQQAATLRSEHRQLVLLGLQAELDAIVAYLACLQAGHAVMVVDPAHGSLCASLQRTYQPGLLWLDTRTAPVRTSSWAHPPVILAPDLALVLSTSGSSGSPKCVMLSHQGLQANAEAIVHYQGIQPEDRALLPLPLFYIYGLSVLHAQLQAGASMVLGQHSLAHEATYDRLRDLKVTSLVTVPLSFQMLEQMGFRQRALPHLRCITQAGGKLHADTVRRYAAWARAEGKRMVVMYGQTEAGPRMSWLPPELAEAHPDAIGRAIPGGTLSLVDDQGHEIQQDQVEGELVYRGPNVMLGYAGSLHDLAHPSRPDRLHTGDLAYRDAHGLFHITGRRSRFAKLYGKRLSLDDVENHLRGQGVEAHCISDDRQLVVFTRGTALPEAARLALAQHFQIAHTDVTTRTVSDWPTLSSGKIDLQALHGMARSVDTPASESTAPAQPLLDRVLALYRASFPGKQVDRQASFESLHGDSLNFIVLSMGLEDALGTLPPDWSRRTIAELVDMAAQAAAAQPSADAGAGPRPPPARRGRQVGATMLLRAAAPCMIIANHMGHTMMAGGAALLMACAGWSLGRFQWRDLTGGRQGLILRQYGLHILIPYYLLLLVSLVKNQGVAWSHVLMVGNLVHEASWITFLPWFIQALTQILVATCALMLIPGLRRLGQHRPWQAVHVLLVVALIFRGLDAWFGWDPHHESRQTSHVAWIYVLGIATALADSTPRRWWLTGLSLSLSVLLYAGDPSRQAFLSLGWLLLIWQPVITLPRIAGQAAGLIASASLFIYVSHFSVLKKLMPITPARQLVAGAICLVVGVLSWQAYRRVTTLIAAGFRRRGKPPAPSGHPAGPGPHH